MVGADERRPERPDTGPAGGAGQRYVQEEDDVCSVFKTHVLYVLWLFESILCLLKGVSCLQNTFMFV